MEKVAICMPVYGGISHNVMIHLCDTFGSAVDHGIEIIGPKGTKMPFVQTTMATDRNRNLIVREVLETEAEWTYWWDSDNINPVTTMKNFLRDAVDGKKMLVGIYVLKGGKNRPVAYYRQPDGRYSNLSGWNVGEIRGIDAAGMNSAFIHREVFEAIDRENVLLQLVRGGTIAVRRENIVGSLLDDEITPNDGKVIDGVLHSRLIEPAEATDVPFFRLQHGETEDIYFWLKAAECGYKLWLDTAVVCGHLLEQELTTDDYWENVREAEKAEGDRS